MRINGENIEENYASLEELLVSNGYNIKQVAVECNGQIIPKAEYSNYKPKSEDSIEVVFFVGGG